MPLTGQIRNQMASQVEAAFNAIEASDETALAELSHQSISFSVSGVNYIFMVGFGIGANSSPAVTILIKKLP